MEGRPSDPGPHLGPTVSARPRQQSNAGGAGSGRKDAPAAAYPARPRRWLARLGVVVLMVFPLLALGSGEPAHALAVPPVPVWLPASIAGAGVVEGAGTVGTVGVIAEGAAAAGAVVATAPVLVVAGAALAAGGAIWVGWHWVSGHQVGYADPAVQPNNGTQLVGCPGSCAMSTSGSSYVATIQIPGNSCRKYFTLQTQIGSTAAYVNTDGYLQMSLIGGGGSFASVYMDANGCGGASGCVAVFGTVPAGYQCAGSVQGGAAVMPGSTVVTTTPISQCSGGGSVSGPGVTYTGASGTNALPAILAPACPAGEVRTGFTTTSTGAGGATVPNPLTWTAPTVPQSFANCAPGGSAAPCVLTLTSIDPAGKVTNCTGTGLCAAYPAALTDGSTYSCKWGTYTMPVSDCATVATMPTTSTSPVSADDPCSQPVTATGQGCAASTGTAADPASDGTTCGGAFSWNPVSWVVNPVKCVMRWAFVPSATTSAALETTQTKLTGKPPFSVLAGMAAWLAPLGALGQTCPDWAVQVKGNSFGLVCGQGFMQDLHSARTFTGAAMIVVALAGFIWRVWHAAVPAFNVLPNTSR